MNRLKQSLSFGNGSPSAPSERPTAEPLSPEAIESISARRQVLTSISTTFASYHRTLAKERIDPRKSEGALGGIGIGKGESKFPTRWFGQALVEAAEALRDSEAQQGEFDDQYCTSLAVVGELQLALGESTDTLVTSLREGFIETLETRMEQFREFDQLLKDADKKRNSLESYMGKAEKSKKSREDYEHELDQLEWGYSDTCEKLRTKAEKIERGTEEEVRALKDLIDVQMDFATNYVNMLENARDQLPLASSQSRPRPRQTTSNSHTSTSTPGSRSPATRSRSSTLALPAASTRMNRSFSDSSAQNIPTSFSAGNLLSSLGPGRTRRSTVSSQSDEKDKEKEREKDKEKDKESSKNRSRSGSVLERFALTGKKKNKADKNGVIGDADANEGTENGKDEEGGGDDPTNRSRSNSSGTSTRWGASPSLLPTLGGFSKKIGSPSTTKYGTLRDSDDHFNLDSDSTERPSLSPTKSSSPASSSRRFVPPSLKRTQTAPSLLSTTSTPSPVSPNSPLRQQQQQQRRQPSFDSSSPVGKTYLAKWAYHPSLQEPDELEFDKGDLVVVERQVNKDWWIGRVVEGRHQQATGGEGMFPSAYVVPHEEEEEKRREDEDRYGEEEERGKWTEFRSTSGSNRKEDEHDESSLLSTSTSTRRTNSTDDEDDGEDDHSRRLQAVEKPFAGQSSTYSPTTRPPPPPIPIQRNGTNGIRKQPPPPPRRTSSYGTKNGSAQKEDEGSPFD